MSLKPFSISIIAITPSFKEVVLLFQHLYIASMLRKEEAERWHLEYESEREREKRSEHTTLCTQNPDPPPYNKIDGIRLDHVSPLTVQLNSYGARYALAGVGSAKCQASSKRCNDKLEQLIAYSDSENGYLY